MFSDARVVTTAALLIQAAGFGKTLLIAIFYGAAVELDGYYLALVVPSLIAAVIGGSLQAGFVSVYVGLLGQKDAARSDQLASQLGTLLLWLLVPTCVLLSVFAQPVMALLVLADDPALLDSAVRAFRVVIFVLLLNSMADYFALVLNSHKRFAVAALSPLANVLISAGILWLWSAAGQAALTYGLLAGVLSQMALLFGALRKNRIRLTLSPPRFSGEVRKVIMLAATMAIGILLVNVNLAVDQIMASLLGEGAVSIIGYANRFHGVVAQILIVGMGTVLLPHLAELIKAGRDQEIRGIYARLSAPLVCAAAAAPIGVTLFASGMLELVLGRGALSAADIHAIATIWFWYTVGLLPMAWGIFLARYFQARHNLTLVTRFAAISVVANISLNLLLIGPLGLAGLAISTTLVYLLTGALYHRRFAMETGFRALGHHAGRLGMLIVGVTVFLAWAFPVALVDARWAPTAVGIALLVACVYIGIREWADASRLERA